MTQPDPATPEETVKRWRWTVCSVCGGATSAGHIHGQFSDGTAELIEVVPLSLLERALEAMEEAEYISRDDLHQIGAKRLDNIEQTARSIRADLGEEGEDR